MEKPELTLEKLKAEHVELYERKREMLASISAYYRRARRETLETVRYAFIRREMDIIEQIAWCHRRITHPEALPMICDLDQVKAERLPPLVEAIFGDKATIKWSNETIMSLRDRCIEAMGTLFLKEQAALFTCFSLGGGPPMTLREVGEKYGLSGERIRGIRDKALRKMRHPTRSRLLKDYLA